MNEPGANKVESGEMSMASANRHVRGETVSVLIATRDRPQLLPRAIESAFAAGRDVEVIVVDDASVSDETERVCRKYERVKYLRALRNQRLGGARNIGLVASRGAYITFLDDDDARLPGSIDLQREALRQNPEAGMVYAPVLLEAADGTLSGEQYPAERPEGDVFWRLMERNFVPCPAAMFRRQSLFTVGLPEDSTPGIEDWDYWLRISELSPVIALSLPVAIYRKANPRSGQFTSDAASLVRLVTSTYITKWRKLPRVAEASRRQRERAWRVFSFNMATHLVWEAGRALNHGETSAALRNLWTALTLHPFATFKRVGAPSNALFAARSVRRLFGRT